jgi:pilus assembly protein CpaF
VNDWTGHNYLPAQGPPCGKGTLLTAQQQAELRRYLLRILPASAFNPGEGGHVEAIQAAIAQALGEKVLPGVSLSPDPATVARLYAETAGLGPLEALLADESVTSITANGPGRLLVEHLDRSGVAFVPGFDSVQSLLHAMESLANRAGRSLTPAEPLIDLVWSSPGGATTRAHLNLLGRSGPFLALRRGRRQAFRLDDYVAQGRMSAEMAAFLAEAVRASVSIVVCGMPGSGKTALLETLLHCTTAEQGHVVLIEDDPEINVRDLAHVSAFQVPRPRLGEEAPIGFLGLVQASLRMNCRSILVCGEVRGAEAGAVVAVMPSYRAVWLTVHGTSPADGLERLVAAAQMGGSRPPSPFSGGRQELLVRRNLAAGLQLLVQMDRFADDRIGVAGIYWLEATSAGGNGEDGPAWDLTPVFEVRQQLAGGELDLSWEANPCFRWPPAVSTRLAASELRARSLDEASFQGETALVRAALEGSRPAEAARQLAALYPLASGDARREAVLGLLRQALLAQPARWADLVERARGVKAQLERRVQERDWDNALRLLEAAERDVEDLVALGEVGVEAIRRQVVKGLEALAAWDQIQQQVSRLARAGRSWEALELLAGQPAELLPPQAAVQLMEMEVEQLRALRHRAKAGEEDAGRVARAILRLLPVSCEDLHRWARSYLSEGEEVHRWSA